MKFLWIVQSLMRYVVTVKVAMLGFDTLAFRPPCHTQLFTKTIAHLFQGNNMESRIQRQYMKQGRYDLYIDEGTQIVPIDGEWDWSKVRAGTQVIMQVVLDREKSKRTQGYQCPRCEAWNSTEDRGREHSHYLHVEWSASFFASKSPTTTYILEAEGVKEGSRYQR